MSYINPCGVVAPEFYDRTGRNWLKSFTAGFMTTCGLNNVGNPCKDTEELGLHCNIGYPFLSPECELIIPSKSIRGANEYSEQNIDCWNMIEEPSEVGEMCFIHELPSVNDTSCVGMFNNKYEIGFLLKFNNKSLDKFLQWRYLNRGEYVIGLEPTTNYASGKSYARENQQLKCIDVGESVQHRIEILFFDSKEKLLENIYCATP